MNMSFAYEREILFSSIANVARMEYYHMYKTKSEYFFQIDLYRKQRNIAVSHMITQNYQKRRIFSFV